MGVKDFMGEKKLVKEEKYDMCEAIQEMMNESWQDGIERGIERGIETGIHVFILDNLEEGFEKEHIIKKLIKRFELTEEKAQEYYAKYGNISAAELN